MQNPAAAQPEKRDNLMTRRQNRYLGASVATLVVPLAVTLLAFFLTDAIPTLEQRSPFLLYLAAVLFSAWYGGTAAGVTATLVSIALRAVLIYADPALALRDPGYLLPLLVFLFVSLFVTSLTARRRREARIAGRQAAFIDLSADAIISRYLDGTITFWSRGAEALYGWTKEEAQGRTTDELFHTEYPEPFQQLTARLKRDGQWQGDLVHTRKDGTRVTASSRWQLQRGENGNPDTILETNTDISDRKRAEEALRESEERFRALFESMNEGFEVDELIRDGEGRPVDYTVLQVNPAYERETGLKRQQVVGRRATEILPVVGPFWLEQFGQVVATGRPTRFEQYSEALGRWFEVYAYSLHEGNRFATLSRDISERKRAEREREELLHREHAARGEAERNERRLAALQEVTSELGKALTLEQVVEVVTVQGLSVLGAAAGSLVLLDESGHRLRIAGSAGLTAEQQEQWAAFALDARVPLAEAVRKNELVLVESPAAYRERYPEAGTGWQSAHLTWLALPLAVGSRVIGGIGLSFSEARRFGQDEERIANTFAQQCAQALERARLYEAEQQARAVAEAAVQLRDQFISIASHELKTPLTSIKGYADLLAQRGQEAHLDEQFQRMARTINTQAGRLEKMVGALLDISRIERGQLSIQREPVDLDKLIRSMVEDMGPTLRRHPLSFQSDAPGLRVEGDETRLEQVFQNLLQNAVKYSPTGGPVAVRLYRRDGMAQVSVTDKGIGIPAEDMPQLFSRFHRAHNAERFHINGLGLGLYVVREIVRLHGGDIMVESREGQGSTFTVSLPLG